MADRAELSRAKRDLLQKFLRGQMELPAAQSIPRRPHGELIPLSFPQEQVWLHAQMAPHLPLYNEPVTIHHTGPLDIGALQAAFKEIVRRHEAWRTSFHNVDGVPFQRVWPDLHVDIPVVDLRHLPQHEREEIASRIATEDATKEFDWGQVPLFRARLMRLEDEAYRLQLTLSHIIFDGVSIYQIFPHELATIYEAFAAGRQHALPELPIQYADFALWQRETHSPEMFSRHMDYWRECRLSDIRAVELPSDRPRVAFRTFRGSMYPFSLSSETKSRISAVIRNTGFTLFQFLLSSFVALLYRYSGEEIFAVGSLTGGRGRPEIQGLLGYFLNTVVLRADVTGNPTFTELMKRMRDATLGALEHDCVPLSRLMHELVTDRDASRNGLFQVMFSLDPPAADVAPAWRLAQTSVNPGTAKYDLYLELNESCEAVLARLHYSTDLFDLQTVERIAGHWIKLIEGAAANPQLRVSELPLLSDSEYRQLVNWNDTQSDFPSGKCLPELVREASESRPQALAARCGKYTLTYSELNQRANRLAHYLRRHGIGSGSLVGIYLERSLEMLIAVLAAMKSGAAYVPLDPAYPRERLRFITEDCGMSMLVTEEGLRDTSPLEASKVICVDERRRQVEQEPSSEPDWTAKPSDLAYVLYTSGSSGKPKGVAIEHHSLANFLTSMLREPGFTSADTLLAVTTLSFDIAGLELYLPLVAGGQVVIATREQASDGLLLQHLMASSGATVMQATPATWGMLLQSGWTGKQDLKILCGGESLPRELAAELVPRCHELWNMYGPTETTIWSSTYKVKEMNWSTALIGQPINNTQMYVLDTDKQLVPVGVAGELYIGGEGLARGYLNNPQEAAKRFIPDPFNGRPNARLYATGDMARYLADGNIQYLGRADTQVKVRGFRIELAEIESVLAQYPGVRQAVAVVQQTPGDAQIVAYMVGHGQMSPDVSDIRNFIAQSLPEYMLPSFFVWLDHLPLTPNGKVDRRALPIPSREIGPEKCELPGDELEQQLLGIFGSVLGLQSAGVTDDFFRLGGHSLTAGQLIARVRNSFGVELPVRAVFEKPTVRSLAVEIRRAQVTGEKMRTPALHKRARAQAAPDSREELVKQLDSLPQHDAQSLLRRVLDSKQCL